MGADVVAKSILRQDMDTCYLCGSCGWLETHHIFGGNPNRKISDKHGFTVRLCPRCHRAGRDSVHNARNQGKDLFLKQTCQRAYEEAHTREEFIALIGKSYL